MKKLATILIATAALSVVASAAFAANSVRISQVYGGGGGSTAGATYTQDYVELFNNSGAAVNIGGWTIEYGAAAGNWGASAAQIFTFPANTLIQPCKYILVALGTVGTNNPTLSPAPDFSNTTTNMSATDGKVALFKSANANLACGSEIAGTLVDKVAYGSGNCPEVTAVGVLTNAKGAVRNGSGTTDSDNNVSDFTVTTNPVPHNSLSPANANCLVTGTTPSTWGSLKTIYR